MKKIISILVLNVLCLMGFSQSNIRINNYWENTYYINPASIYSEYRYVASASARQQWIGFPGAPDSEYLTFTAKVNKRNLQAGQAGIEGLDGLIGQFGIKVIRDMIGYTQFINIAPSYSYSVGLNNGWRANFGVAFSFQQVSYNLDKIILETEGDPIRNKIENSWGDNNADVGIEIIGKKVLAGVASQNLMSLFSNDDKIQTNTNFLYFMFRTELNKPINLLGGICAINNEDLYQMELNVSGLLKLRRSRELQLGVLYRTKKEYAVLCGVDVSETARLAVSYDYNIGNIRRSSIGTTEILLLLKFGRLRKCQCGDLYK